MHYIIYLCLSIYLSLSLYLSTSTSIYLSRSRSNRSFPVALSILSPIDAGHRYTAPMGMCGDIDMEAANPWARQVS